MQLSKAKNRVSKVGNYMKLGRPLRGVYCTWAFIVTEKRGMRMADIGCLRMRDATSMNY